MSKPSSRSITSAAKDVLTPNTAIAEVTRIRFNNFLFIHAPVRLNYNVIYSTIVPCSSISLTKSFPCSHTVASFDLDVYRLDYLYNPHQCSNVPYGLHRGAKQNGDNVTWFNLQNIP